MGQQQVRRWLQPSFLGVSFASAIAVSVSSLAGAAQAFTITNTQTSQSFVGVTHQRLTGNLGASRPISVNATIIDLNAPGVSLGVTAPNQDGTTTPETTLAYAQRVNAQVSINANFYTANFGNFPFVTTSVQGVAASGGQGYGTPITGTSGTINFSANNQASFYLPGQTPNPGLFNAVSGNMVLVQNGEVNPDGGTVFDTVARARTAMGMTATNQLILFVVDGTESSGGLSHGELASVMRNQFNANYAINLDGGDSSQMVLCQPTCAYANTPPNINVSMGPFSYTGPRPVGNNFAVFAQPVPMPPQFLGMLVMGGLTAGKRWLGGKRGAKPA
jgi:hypothetical protein